MAISRERKEALVAEYVDLLQNSRAIFLADYTGMDVKTFDALRHEVREVDGSFHVTKNTLMRVALERSGYPIPDELLTGQLATGFALGEAPSLAKTLVDFAKKENVLKLRGGIMEANVLSSEDIDALAKLPSLEELRAQLLGVISGPARNVAAAVASGVRQLVNVVDAYAKQEESAESAA